MKLTKPQLKAHEECLKILTKDRLGLDEREFVFENFLPAYTNHISKAGQFFTPMQVARDFAVEVSGKSIIDLCAGIGMLAWQSASYDAKRIVCIERDAHFVEVGKKVFPDAQWICSDVLDQSIYKELGRFDCAISNPPFGKDAKSIEDRSWLRYKGSDVEYCVVEIGAIMAKQGTFILPNGSVDFDMVKPHETIPSTRYDTFLKQTKIRLERNCGIDVNQYENEWKGANPKVQITVAEFEDYTPIVKQATLF